jgi:hypothetical protein
VNASSWLTDVPDGPLGAGHWGLAVDLKGSPNTLQVGGYTIRYSGKTTVVLHGSNGNQVGQFTATSGPSPGFTFFRGTFDLSKLAPDTYTAESTSNDQRDFFHGNPPLIKQTFTFPFPTDGSKPLPHNH